MEYPVIISQCFFYEGLALYKLAFVGPLLHSNYDILNFMCLILICNK